MGMISKAYLILYNLALTLGWGYMLYLSIESRNDLTKMWSKVELPLKICQTAALLEVVHAAIGIVKSNVFLTFFQVLSRVFVLWCALNISPPSQTCLGVPMIMFAWNITEIIRYGYYFLNLINMSSLIVWFRYTLFIALYPIGVTGELIILYHASEYAKRTGMWTLKMPNKFNATFDFQYFLYLSMLVYIPIFPQLYLHMFAQRRKILGGGGNAESKKVK